MAPTVIAFLIALCLLQGKTDQQMNVDAVSTEQTLRILALGDSYTIGEAVDVGERWPVHLLHRLRRRGFPVEDPVIVARTGWTTAELDAGIRETRPSGVFGLVSLLIGVNNQYRGGDTVEYRREFKSLLEQAVTFSGEMPFNVVVLSIPDWGVTPFAEGQDRQGIADAIDAFNLVNRDEAMRAGVHYVDVTASSRLAANDTSLLASDGLHPSGRMYELWTMLVLAEMFPE